MSLVEVSKSVRVCVRCLAPRRATTTYYCPRLPGQTHTWTSVDAIVALDDSDLPELADALDAGSDACRDGLDDSSLSPRRLAAMREAAERLRDAAQALRELEEAL